MDRENTLSPASGEVSEPTIMAETETVRVNLYGHMLTLNEGDNSHQEVIDAIHTVVDKLADKGETLDEVVNLTIRVEPIESEYINGLQIVGTSEFHHEK